MTYGIFVVSTTLAGHSTFATHPPKLLRSGGATRGAPSMGFPGQIAGFLLIGPSPFRAIPGSKSRDLLPPFPVRGKRGPISW